MNYSVLLFLLILKTTQTTSLHHHCNSDVYSSASGMADLQQFTTLQYCLIDNCTIIRIDTGQQLDIVYTIQSHLVVTSTDGQTSMLISKNDPELFCSTPNTTNNSAIVIQVIMGRSMAALLALVSGCIIAVHMMFKELRNTFGKLMMLSNIGVIGQCFTTSALTILHHIVPIHSTMPCYLFYFLFMQSVMVADTFSTTFLAYFAYLMRSTYKAEK